MVGYALPNTIWQSVSAASLIHRAVVEAHPLTALVVSGALFAAVWISFARDARSDAWAQTVWLLLVVWASGYLFDPPGRGYRGVEMIRCALVLAMAGCGLLCARVLKPGELMALVVLLAGMQAGYALYYYFTGRNLFYTYQIGRAGGTFGTPVHVYTQMLMAIPMGVALWRVRRERIARVVLPLVLVLHLFALWVTYARSAWFAMSVVLPGIIWALWRNRRLAMVTGVVMWIALLGMYTLRIVGSPQYRDTTAQARVDVWRMGWQTFTRNWLWGVGTDNVRLYYTSTWRGYPVSTWYGAPENQLLLWLCERGIWGGLFAVFLIISLYRRLREMSPHLRWGLGGALLAMGILGMFQSVFGRIEEGVETVLVNAIWGAIVRGEAAHDG